jgi:hypothetical protein
LSADAINPPESKDSFPAEPHSRDGSDNLYYEEQRATTYSVVLHFRKFNDFTSIGHLFQAQGVRIAEFGII